MSFSVIGAAKMITVVSPAASTNVSRGVDFQITWTSQNITGNVKIELYKASSLLSVISSSASNSGSFTWAVPPSLAAASDYTVKITSLSDTSVSGTSGVFSIVTSSRQYSETVLSSSAFIGGGTARGWSGDDKSWLYTLPFSFPYYGSSYSAVYVNSNGYLDFASPVPDWEPDISKLIVSKRICPFWSDLTVSEIYIHQPSSDSVCIRWAGTVCATGSALNIEAVLHKNGKVRFNYGAGNLAASPPVTGMSAGDGKSYDLSCYYGLTAFGNINSEEFTPLNGAPQTAVIKLEPQPAPGGAGNPSAYTTVITGAQTDISASAGVGYRFYAWTCDEGAVFSSQTPGSKVSVSNNRKIFANFISSAAGTLGAWGDNASGQLTMNSVTAKKTYPVYIADQAGTPVSGLSAVSAGYYHTLALSSSGTVLAWGNNSSGQLGDGTAVTRRSPVTTLRADGSVFSGVIKISGGAYHSLAITSDGIVWAWGGNSKGQLGDGTTTDRKNPVQALKSGGSAITGAVDVSAGYDHSLALLADGTVYAWGGNSKGQLGNGSQTDQPGAVQVKNSNGTPFTNAAKICAGECSSFAVSSGAYLYSWGDNSSGQLGAGSQTPYRLYPATVKKSDGVTDFSNIAGVSIKRKTAAALTGSSDYGVYVWGDNSSGQVFGGYAALVYYPVRLFGGSEYSAVAAGGSHVLALRNEGRISAWGGNSLGQLGDSTSVTPVSPVATAYASDKPLVSASLITAGADFSCALFASPPVTPHLSGDFNGDGKSDLLFAGVSSQSDLLSFMSGVSPSVSVALPLASASSAAVAVGDFNGDGFADVIIRDSSAGTVQVWLLKNGAVISSGTVFGGDPSWKIIAAADFDGDGRDDILWQHETTAQTVIYLMDGTTIRQWGIIYDGADKNFKAALAGDLNGDGKADILWRNSSTGNVHGWLMSGFNILSQGVIYNGGDKAWLPVAMGDLNGDGKADIIWRHDNSGQVVCYFMSGLQLLSSAVLYNGADKNWRVAFCGDFNGDGYYDLAWRNISSGSAGIWLMKGSTVLETAEIASGSQGWTLGGDKDAGAAVLSFSITGDGSGSASIPPGPNNIYSNMYYSLSATPASGSRFGGWTLGGDAYISRTADLTARIILYGSSASLSASFLRNAALGDFNADRKADLLWSHVSTGAGSLWLMDGFSKLASGTVYDGGDSGWRIVGKGDLNGDGKCDIVWRHNTTALVVGYLMDGTTLLGWGIIYGGGDANWKVCAVGDVNGDGKADIIWRNSSTGQVIVYLMNGVTMTSYRVIFDSDKNWVPVGSADFDGDSMSDILWRNTSTNAVVIWLMNGFDIKNMGFIYDGSDKAWGPEATGDINGDGKADIIWRNSSTGWTLGYLMDGLTLKQYGNIVQTDSLNWKVSDSGDYNGDGKADMCLRHDATGEVRMLLLNGLSVISSQTVRSGGDANIILIGNVTDSSK
jgi:alpha-tubulin suppressor-like RCC1 family protein